MESTLPVVSPLMNELAHYLSEAIARPLPESVMLAAKARLVDTFGAMLSGGALRPGRMAISFTRSLGVAEAEAGVVGTTLVTSIPQAALANGMLAHADESDDTHPASNTHPGCSVIPAALAVAEREGRSGTSLLRSIVLGYDVCARVMLALGPPSFMPAGHNPCAFGQVFGAAAAAAGLLKLDSRQMRYVISYAAQQAAGLSTMLRDTDHIEKAYCMGGMPAQHGVLAALMVQHGFTGVDDVLSGDRNFFFTYGRPEGDPNEMTRGLGRDYEILQGGIKRWAAGGPIQGPLSVLQEMMIEHTLKSDSIAKLVLWMPDKEFATVNNRSMTNISVQHLMGIMLVDGTVTFKSAHDVKRVSDARVLALRERMQVHGDPALTDLQRRWRAVIEITLDDGRVLKHSSMATQGTAENPMSSAQLNEKVTDLIEPVLGTARTGTLLDALWNAESLDDVRTLRVLYARERETVHSGQAT